MFFMHLKGEKPMVFWPLGLTAVLFVALFAFVLWTEGDHLFGTRSAMRSVRTSERLFRRVTK